MGECKVAKTQRGIYNFSESRIPCETVGLSPLSERSDVPNRDSLNLICYRAINYPASFQTPSGLIGCVYLSKRVSDRMPHHIFLSYSRKDAEIMQRMKDDFVAAGLSVWTDEGIEPGTPSWKNAIEEAITETECLVCILSPDAKSSRWVRAELNHAELHEKPIFLILARGNMRDAIPFGFNETQLTDIRVEGLYTVEVERLIRVIKKRLDIENRTTQASPQYPLNVSGILPPPFEWCEIPTGWVRLSELEGYLKYGREFEVKRFWMAKYPVTNAQFRVFADATDGYGDATWWDYSVTAREWRNTNAYAKRTELEADDLPRTNVTWYETVAFCKWLSWKAQLIGRFPAYNQEVALSTFTLRLPSEQEWQRAAQGDDGRIYPWGNAFEKSRANVYETGIGKMTPVTRFPDGSSPFGVMDMVGNTWEWCLTKWDTGFNDIDGDAPRVLRGGSWGDLHNLARCSARGGRGPIYADIDRGFRIALIPAYENAGG